ncbi:aldo/keto reductase [Neobacillus mesonae]|nr:aldo/keto reductase [Neobacillus mesonae]
MKKNRLGSSDLYVSEVGLGCMSLGTDENTAVSLIHEALEHGVNFLDTADIYDDGRNEEIVGAAIKGRRQDVILATKAGNRRIPGQTGLSWDPSKKHILSAVKESLRRLQTDYIDLYQLHGGTIEDNIEETIEAFEQLKQEGVIRYYGVSSIRPNVIREYVQRSQIVSVMNQYSLLDRRGEEEAYPLLNQHGISVIARGPVASGALADGRDDKAAKGFLNYTGEQITDIRAGLDPLVNEHRSMSQTAIRYVLHNPVVATVIPGASSRTQLLENVRAAETPDLTDEEYNLLREITQANQYTQHR